MRHLFRGLPLSVYMDYSPRQVMELTRSDFKNEVLRSHTIWLCASCYACTVECPREIRITDIMYELKQRAIKERVYPGAFRSRSWRASSPTWSEKNGRITEMLLVMKLFLKTSWLAGMKNWRMGLDLMRPGALARHREDQSARGHRADAGYGGRQERKLSHEILLLSRLFTQRPRAAPTRSRCCRS
jgi:quinone-modifying oxidoreductase, subunit QmoC